MSVTLGLKLANGRLANPNASVSVVIFFRNQSRFVDLLSSSHFDEHLQISLSALQAKDYRKEVVFRAGQTVLDLYFGNEVSGKATLTGSVSENRVVLRRKGSGDALLIWAKSYSSVEVDLVPAPSLQAIQNLQTAFSSSDKVLQGAGTAAPLLAGLAVFSAGGLGGPLMKFFKVFKMASRLRLINVEFGVYLGMFLTACNSVFRIGGDQFDLQTLQASPQTRGLADARGQTLQTQDPHLHPESLEALIKRLSAELAGRVGPSAAVHRRGHRCLLLLSAVCRTPEQAVGLECDGNGELRLVSLLNRHPRCRLCSPALRKLELDVPNPQN